MLEAFADQNEWTGGTVTLPMIAAISRAGLVASLVFFCLAGCGRTDSVPLDPDAIGLAGRPIKQCTGKAVSAVVLVESCEELDDYLGPFLSAQRSREESLDVLLSLCAMGRLQKDLRFQRAADEAGAVAVAEIRSDLCLLASSMPRDVPNIVD